MGVKPLPCELACCEQPPICLFPLPASDAFLMWFARIAVIRDQINQRSFAVPFAPTLHGEFSFRFGLWDHGSRRQALQLRKNRIHRSNYMLSGALLEPWVHRAGGVWSGAICAAWRGIPALFFLS